MKRNLLTVMAGVWWLCVFANAQTVLDLKEYKQKYPNEHSIYLDKREHFIIALGDDGLEINSTEHNRVLYLQSFSGKMPEESVYYSSFHNFIDLKAHTLVPEGKKYRKLPVTAFYEKTDFASHVFHDDTKTRTFYFPGIQEGAITEMFSTKQLTAAELLGWFNYGSYSSVRQAELKVEYDDAVEMVFSHYNLDTSKVTETKERRKDRWVHTFTYRDVPRLKYEISAPGYFTMSPHTIMYIKNYMQAGQRYQVFDSPADLNAWYGKLYRQIKNEDKTAVKSLVDSLVNNETDAFRRMEKIFDWVDKQIKYIAIEDGYSGFIPADANTVLQARYGDCKGMSSLLVQMLKEAGLERSYLTLVGTRDLPYKYTETPCPVVDNHMIATCVIDTSYYFLDATGGLSTFTMPSSFIQGKQALIHIDSVRYLIKTIPVVHAKDNAYIDTCYVQLHNKTIVGTGTTLLKGYSANLIENQLAHEDYNEMVHLLNGFYEKGSNKFLLDTVWCEKKNDDIALNYTFTVQDYVRVIGNKTYLNLNLNESLFQEKIKKDREAPIAFKFATCYDVTTLFTIPVGYKVEEMPSASGWKDEDFGYELQYAMSNDTITLHFRSYCNKLELPREDFERWNDMCNRLSDSARDILTLIKTN